MQEKGEEEVGPPTEREREGEVSPHIKEKKRKNVQIMNKNDSNAKQGRLTESFKGNMDFQAKHKGEFSLRNLNP